MSDDLKRAMARMERQLAGDGPLEKQVMLLKLTDLYENRPPNARPPFDGASPQRQWLSAVGALINRYDRSRFGVRFNTQLSLLALRTGPDLNEFVGQTTDVIEAIKLELELDGREQIGNAYAPGSYYDYFADLKRVLGDAEQRILIIDPYFDGDAFDAYLSDLRDIELQVLGDKYLVDAKAYADKHSAQHGTTIELRRSKELHDRMIIIDDSDCWITGGSVKDAGKKAAYLIPAMPQIAEAKRQIYAEIWQRASAL